MVTSTKREQIVSSTYDASDVNTLKTTGLYGSSNTVANAPDFTLGGGTCDFIIIEVTSHKDGANGIQKAWPADQDTNADFSYFYLRTWEGETWSEWYRFDATRTGSQAWRDYGTYTMVSATTSVSAEFEFDKQLGGFGKFTTESGVNGWSLRYEHNNTEDVYLQIKRLEANFPSSLTGGSTETTVVERSLQSALTSDDLIFRNISRGDYMEAEVTIYNSDRSILAGYEFKTIPVSNTQLAFFWRPVVYAR